MATKVQITKWKDDEGNLHDTEAEANASCLKLKLAEFLDGVDLTNAWGDITEEAVADAIVEHWSEISKIMKGA